MNIFVAGSSRETKNQDYIKAAQEVGRFLSAGEHNLVFGGSQNGLIGKVYSTFKDSTDGFIIVATCKAYADDLNGLEYNKVFLKDTLSQRKSELITLSDAMIFLPGGIGTIDELMTAIETKRCKEHSKPILIFNVNGYFTTLLDSLLQSCFESFSNFADIDLFKICTTIEDIEEALK